MALVSKSFSDLITFTRASSATRVNSSGLIETVSSDVARIDYDPVTLAAKGLLIEEQRTNLLVRSTWEGGTAGVEGSGAVAPTGWSFAATTGSVSYPTSTLYPSATAIRFVAAAQRPMLAQNVTLLANTTYSQSVYVEAVDGGASILSDNIVASLPSGTTTYYIDGVVVSSATVLTAGKRVVAVHAVGGTGGSAQIRYGLGVSGAATGDVTLSCPQLEAGAFATSYIPTTSATVTRAADVESMTGTNFSDWYNQTEGTFLIQLVPKGLPSSSARYLEASIAGAAIRTPVLYATSAGSAVVMVTNVSVIQAILSHSGAFAIGSRLKHAAAYKTDDFASVANGGAPQTDASGTIGLPDRLTIGWATSSPADIFNGWIERLTYYPARLSNALLQSLTA